MGEMVTGTVSGVLLVAVLVGSCALARERVPGPLFRLPPPRAAVVLWAVVAVPSLVQIPAPVVLHAFERDPALLRDGHWWRILTSGMVQDGGVLGTVVNLGVLAAVAPMAVAVWGTWRAVFLLVASQIIVGLTMAFLFPSSGAGNSGATWALAASVVGLVVMSAAGRRELTIGVAVLGGGVVLVSLGDVHGFGVLTGALLGAAVATVIPPVPVRRPVGAGRRGS